MIDLEENYKLIETLDEKLKQLGVTLTLLVWKMI